MDSFSLKDGLLSGVSLPATQCLGGEIESNWVYWWGLGYIRDHASPVVAAQHAAHWREDLALMEDLGVQAVRLGVDWTRVEPREEEFDEAELKRVREELTALKAAGMRVTVELHRFTNPVWFEEKGGFEREENLSGYLSYVEHAAAYFGDCVDEYLTFAEPNAYAVGGYLGGDYPPGKNNPSACYRVLTHMAQCHILAYDLLRQVHEAMEFPPARVSVSLRARELATANVRSAAQRLLVAAAEQSFDAAFRAFYLGQTRLPMKYNKYVVPGKYCDFLALDWYGRMDVAEPLDLTPFAKRGGIGSPKALLALLHRLRALAPLPVHVALAGVEDGDRIDLLATYLRALSGSSLPIERCICAPLLDGFEWLDGNAKRLGLVRVDFETQERALKLSGGFFRDVARARAARIRRCLKNTAGRYIIPLSFGKGRFMDQIIESFALPGRAVSCEPYGHGHVNRTYLVRLAGGREYILQRLSRTAFHDIPGLMENVASVTKFLAAQSNDPRACLHLLPTTDGRDYLVDSEGEYWRMFDFVADSVCLQSAETPADFYQSAIAFGSFQCMLRDFPAETLHETIPHFHDTPDRYRKFRAALEADAMGRAKDVRPEIDFALSREKDAAALQNMRDAGTLPLRVTHNDTKLNNVMLDAKTHKALCVIDLDTVMPGLAAYDFGDSIRFGASTGAEDEKDLGRISLDLELYRTFTQGFVAACAGLTDAELDSLPLGAKTITLECGVRFLTDYLEGDRYFAVSRPEHNLDRARTQFRLVEDMERKWSDMCAIVQEAKQSAR